MPCPLGSALVALAPLLVPSPEPGQPPPDALTHRVHAPEPGADTEGARVFLEAWNVANVAFYDPAMHGVDWPGVRDELLPRARTLTGAPLSALINEALDRLHASHTAHYTPDQREYHELLDIFRPDGVPARPGSRITPGPVAYVGIGLATATIDGRTFAADVYDDGPAARAGILPGDELLAVEAGPWADVAPFRERAGVPTRITIQRTPDAASRIELEVVPETIHPRDLFLRSMRKGARLVERDGKRIAIVRVRSYGHTDYHDLLKELLADPLKDADALVLDLRGGWGGANPGYLDIFNPIVPSLAHRARDGSTRTYNAAWERPAAVLIDSGSRSGKEVLAHAIRQHGVATLVGERTAGAVLAGTLRPLADGSVLYIAIGDVTVDGERLEGVGVEPHVPVARDLPWSAGRDPQLDAALELLATAEPSRRP